MKRKVLLEIKFFFEISIECKVIIQSCVNIFVLFLLNWKCVFYKKLLNFTAIFLPDNLTFHQFTD